MSLAGERAYSYAKACGIIGKSFVGKRMAALGQVTRLSELDRLVFHGESHDLPEKELMIDLEDRLAGRAVHEIISVIDSFQKPPELLILLLRAYEYADLETALASALRGEKRNPFFTDLGKYQVVNFQAWPDIPKMLHGTEFEFLLSRDGVLYQDLGGVSLQTVLDRHYYEKLWAALFELPKGDRETAEKILTEEITLRNAVWALRLRTYYWMSGDEVRLHLIYIPSKGARFAHHSHAARIGIHTEGGALGAHGRSPHREPSLADEALESLNLPLDNHDAWKGWGLLRFMNPAAPGDTWVADPRFFQNAASEYLYHLARYNFHLHPSSMDTIVCFIKLIQFEEDILTSNAEGLGLGLSSRDVLTMLEVKL